MANMVGNWGGGAVWRVTSGTFPSNTYFCEADVPGGAILIDSGLDGLAIDAEMMEQGLRPHQVFCTHGHFDHAGSAAYFQKKYGCQVFMHKADTHILKTSNFLLMALKIQQKIELPNVTFIEDQFSMDINGQPLRYLSAPGHTPGSCVVELGSAWFTGDTIYSQGVGLSQLPGENVDQLKSSIRGLWERLTVDRTVYPGHGNSADGASVRCENHALLKFLGLLEIKN
jgi:hydroxyacylglutathione hydrolase